MKVAIYSQKQIYLSPYYFHTIGEGEPILSSTKTSLLQHSDRVHINLHLSQTNTIQKNLHKYSYVLTTTESICH